MMKTEDIKQYIDQYQIKVTSVCSALKSSYLDIGFTDPLEINKEKIKYDLIKDNFTGKYSLQGIWNNQAGYQQGMLLFHPDGSFYAEYDVVKPHPQKSNWFVESVTAWGRDDNIKSEPRLLSAVE